MIKTNKRCKLGLWDYSVPGIWFDSEGISNYAKIQLQLMKDYPRGKKGLGDWLKIVNSAKEQGKNKRYDCIVGVSGGVDSSYLLYLVKEVYKLRPLAVTLDNGWNTEIAVSNIKKITDLLNVDLETYVIDYEEIKDLMRSYMYATLPWIDVPTDNAIKAVMFKYALREKVKFIFRGNDFRTEGKQPREWTYSDLKQMKYVHKKFGKTKKIKTYPWLSYKNLFFYGFIKNIKEYRPYYYLEYSKSNAREFLEKEYGWKYYGGHHHENIFTKYTMSNWLPIKFGIDKRIINLSAQVVSGLLSRESALNQLNEPFLNENERNDIENYIKKKLDLSSTAYIEIVKSPNHTYKDYPNYEKMLIYLLKHFSSIIRLIFKQKPMTFTELEINEINRNQ